MDLQFLEGTVKCDALGCRLYRSFQQTICVLYFDLLSTEEDWLLPSQNGSFFSKTMGNHEIWSLHELLMTPFAVVSEALQHGLCASPIPTLSFQRSARNELQNNYCSAWLQI